MKLVVTIPSLGGAKLLRGYTSIFAEFGYRVYDMFIQQKRCMCTAMMLSVLFNCIHRLYSIKYVYTVNEFRVV